MFFKNINGLLADNLFIKSKKTGFQVDSTGRLYGFDSSGDFLLRNVWGEVFVTEAYPTFSTNSTTYQTVFTFDGPFKNGHKYLIFVYMLASASGAANVLLRFVQNNAYDVNIVKNINAAGVFLDTLFFRYLEKTNDMSNQITLYARSSAVNRTIALSDIRIWTYRVG